MKTYATKHEEYRDANASNRHVPTLAEKKRYVLSTKKDHLILYKIKQLEKLRLTEPEKFIVQLARTQLERDWRKGLIKALDHILKSARRR
ncbi:hypothetical protein HYU19_06040 [Candidatus Woesearchaeota archaeon]|nr:hypothetical protein [Candidatus Woesearchaeota archaeon]